MKVTTIIPYYFSNHILTLFPQNESNFRRVPFTGHSSSDLLLFPIVKENEKRHNWKVLQQYFYYLDKLFPHLLSHNYPFTYHVICLQDLTPLWTTYPPWLSSCHTDLIGLTDPQLLSRSLSKLRVYSSDLERKDSLSISSHNSVKHI